jgi:hypothetical protein
MVYYGKLLAWYAKEVGTAEVPTGSNSGPRVSFYQSSTGAYHAPWCVSFLQKGLQSLGIPRVADRSAGVFYVVGWAKKHGLVRSNPKAGYFVAFMHDQGHIGIVKSVSTNSFTTIEGNASNRVRGDRVYQRSGNYYVFIQVPGVDYGDKKPLPKPPPKPAYVPRFQIVAGEGTKAKVLVNWGKWKVVSARIPTLAAKRRAVSVKRKLVKNPAK